LTLQSSGGHRNKQLVFASALLPHRIEGEVAESAAGNFAPIIESQTRLIACGAWAARGASPSTGVQTGQKAGKRWWKPDLSRDRRAFIECGKACARARRSGTRDLRGIESVRRWASNQFHAISKAHEVTTRRKLPFQVGSRVALAADCCAVLRVAETHRARKHAPKRAIPDIGRS